MQSVGDLELNGNPTMVRICDKAELTMLNGLMAFPKPKKHLSDLLTPLQTDLMGFNRENAILRESAENPL